MMKMLIFRIWELPAVYAHIARVAQCARIAIRHPDHQKHTFFSRLFKISFNSIAVEHGQLPTSLVIRLFFWLKVQ